MRHTLAALAVTLVAAVFAAEAQAADSISFGDKGSGATFGANEIVGIDGSITYRNDCPKPGIDDWFYPATDVYLVPAGSGTGTLQDVGGGRPNTIVATATAFLDEVIAMTAPAGNLDEGEYDVVYDTCQDGEFDPGFDTVFAGAVTVRLPDVLPLADGAIGRIKSEARDEYAAWMKTRKDMSGIFKLADRALKVQCKAGNAIGCAMRKLDYFDGVKERFLTLLLSQANHYLAIAEDPPDANFDTLTTLAPVDVPRDHSDSELGNALADALRPFAGEAAVSAALLRAVERYQGAQAAGDADWALVHARQALNLTETLREVVPAGGDALADLRAAVSDPQLDPAITAGRSFTQRVWNSGLTAGERRALLNQGLSTTRIAKLETEVRGIALENSLVDGASIVAALDQTRAAHSATASALDSAAADWEEIVVALEARSDRPAVDAGGLYDATAGTALTLEGSAAGDWDLDGDGEFDDADGREPSVTFDEAGTRVIGLRTSGAVSYAVVRVTGGQPAPVISSAVPAARSATVTVGSPVDFSVTTSAAAAYAWTIDGAPAGYGAALTYAPAAADVGSHTIEVTLSGKTRRTWDVVVLDGDPDADGWTKTTDCDETDPAVHPAADERLGNGLDDDCDPSTADAPPGGLTGSLRSWGSNHNGTIGIGTGTPTLVPSPVAVPGLDDVVQMEHGDRSQYAVLASGQVRAWGFNGTGGLGIGVFGSAQLSPVSPLAVGGGGGHLSGVTQLAASSHGHVLARRTDGSVVAWGQNQARQVGDGSTVNMRLYPVHVVTGADGPPLTGVRAVEASTSGSYAIMEDGTVRSWGYIHCDGGTSIRQEPFPVPLPLVGGDVRQLSSSGYWTLILKKDGTVLSCGALAPVAGRPVPTIGDVYVPKPVTGFGPGSGVVDISAGGEAGLALKADGSVWLWGANNNWELGVLGKSGPASVPAPTQVPLPPGPPVVDVEMDDACHALLERADGSVLAWGCDFFEQVGNGPGPQTGVITPTVIAMPGRSAIGVSTGGWNSLALTRPAADPEWEPPATWVDASVADATVAEAGGTFEISLSAALPHDVRVDWTLEAGTAGAADVTLGDGTATVPAGATTVEVAAPVLDDALDEDAETFTVALRDASHGIRLAREQAAGTIEDDDAPPAVSVHPASVAEGDTSLADGRVKVRLSEPSGKPVTVGFATADGTATSPGDYAPASGRLAIAAGELEAVVHVAVRGDTAIEPDEALSMSLAEPENATLGDASAALTIADDEPLALAVESPQVGEGETAEFTVALDAAAPTGTVSVGYEVVGVTASVPGDVAAASGTLVFGPGETSKQVGVQVHGDAEVEGDEAFRLALRDVVADRRVMRGESTVATIVDDDGEEAPPPPPSPSDTTPPVTTATGHPAGWSRDSVTVSLTATDEGSGVKEIRYRIAGQTTTVPGASASIPVSADGATTIAYAAEDHAGNVEAERTLVVRIDRTQPVVSCTATPSRLWPPNHRLVPVTVEVQVQDGGAGAGGFTLVSVTSSEPDDAPGGGDGRTTGDIRGFVAGTADTAGRLRAERAGKGSGRVYTLTYAGRDAAGNESECTATVRVPHSKARAAAKKPPRAGRRR